jgi:branched-subunit amino acid ABC-type transport system permease component
VYLQQVVQGLSVGAVYGLIGIGIALIYRTARIYQFAQGDLAMIGAYVAFGVFAVWGLPPFVALVGAFVFTMVVGLLIERLAVRPMGGNALRSLISTMAVALLLRELVRVFVDADPRNFPSVFGDDAVNVGGIIIVPQNVWVLFLSVAIAAGLHLFLARSRTGRSLRSVAQDPDAAAIHGVDLRRAAVITFAIASALAGVAGFLIAPLSYLSPTLGVLIGLKGFAAAIVGGMGSIQGAMAGGLLIGMLEALSIGFLPSGYRDAIAFALLAFILLVKPAGLVGARAL